MKFLFFAATSIFVFGCAPQIQYPEHRLGQFTAASSYNVRNLNYDKDTAIHVVGEDCAGLNGLVNDSRLQRAMDAAIKNGQGKGVQGDLLINVRIDQIVKYRQNLFSQIPYECIKVEGDLVSMK